MHRTCLIFGHTLIPVSVFNSVSAGVMPAGCFLQLVGDEDSFKPFKESETLFTLRSVWLMLDWISGRDSLL